MVYNHLVKAIKKWNEQGFFIENSFFNEKELTDIMNILNTITFNNKEDFGSDNGFLEFPTSYSILNHLTLHPKIIKYCKTLLNTSDIRLIQSDFWNKTNNGKTHMDSNSDQRMHMDYPNNYLTHPNNWRNPDYIAIIIYFSDHLEYGGETSVVPRLSDKDYLYKPPYTNNIGLGNYKWANDKYSVEKYFKENYPDVYHFRKKLYEKVYYHIKKVVYFFIDMIYGIEEHLLKMVKIELLSTLR